MSNQISITQVERDLSKMASEFEKVLPPSITPEAFVRICKTAIAKQPELLETTPRSIFESAMQCAQDNLLPDGREAAFVVRNMKVIVDGIDTYVKTCTYMPMVKGIMKRLKEQGEVTSVFAYCVHENDFFEFALGDNPTISHKPPAMQDRGKIIGAYAIFKKDNEVLHREVMNLLEIEKVRQSSTTKGFSPWNSFFEEMARKTVVRRGAKYVIHSQKSNDVLDRDNVFYDLDHTQPQQRSALTPPSVKHLGLGNKPEPEKEIQGEVEEATAEPEIATSDDIPINPETVISNLKDDLERAQDVDDVNNARDANQDDLMNLPENYQKTANEMFTTRLDELEAA